MTETYPTGTQRVLDDAKRRGLAVRLAYRPHTSSLDEAATALAVAPRDIVKSLVVRRHDGDCLFALIPGDRKISWPKLRAVVGVNKLSMPDRARAFDATGFESGTITPLGSSTAWPVYADELILGRLVAMGSGSHDHSIFVHADELVEAVKATIADISDPM